MYKKLVLALALFCSAMLHSQVVINELDADTPGTDTLEFLELKSTTPNFPLDGYVLVFYNGLTTGTGTASYYALDLDSFVTDVNGIIHFGNPNVSPTPAIIIPNATIQNGPDAVALYLGDATDFPTNSAATSANLIDSFCYTNSTTVQASALMTVLNNSVCTYDNQGLYTASKSIQRKPDGTYEIKTPTPGMNNDGSGIVLTYLSLVTSTNTILEGQNLDITYTSTQAVTGSDLVINFSLANGVFNSNDYSGTTSVTIPVGATSGSTTIQILNDGSNEGDEELKVVANSIPTTYSLYNNNVIVRVNDINFAVLSFGTPSNPTYGTVLSTAPSGYYSSLEGLSGTALKQALQDIIANPSVVRAHTYGDIVDILKTADQNPENSNQVWMIYTEQPRSKIDYQTGNSIIGKWNREHVYCQSRGNYGDLYNLPADGIATYAMSGPDDIGAGLSDAHHLRAVDGQENSSRNNRNYGVDYNGPTGAPGSWKGDVARAVFYMAVRYNGLNVVNGNPTDGIIGQIGDLSSLLTWNHTDVSDDYEMNRNNYIYTWQMNRNPFIDYPDLADYIWGSHAGEVWHASLSTTSFTNSNIVVYPNPTKNVFAVSGLTYDTTISLYSILGNKLFENKASFQTSIDISNYDSGIYILKIKANGLTTERKIIKE